MTLWKKLSLLMLVLTSMTLTSCLDILEEITVKKAGDGHYKMVVDMSQAKEMLEMLKTMGTGQDSSGMGDAAGSLNQMGTAMDAQTAMLKNLRGLTNVKTINDTTKLVFGYEFDFADVNALNRAEKKLAEQSEMTKDMPEAIFSFKKGRFERLDASASMLNEIMGQLGGADGEQAKMMFADLTATTIYHFPDQAVKKQNHEFGKISADGHDIKIEVKPFADGADLKKMGSAISIKLK